MKNNHQTIKEEIFVCFLFENIRHGQIVDYSYSYKPFALFKWSCLTVMWLIYN